MTRDIKQFKIAIPADIKRWIAIQAATNMRSQSSEILIAIREKMERVAKAEGDAK